MISTILCFLFGLYCTVSPQFSATIAYPPVGGTGSTTLSGILVGNGTSPVKTLTIGTNLTLTGTTLDASGGGAASAYEIATTSDIAIPQLTYITKTGGRTTLGSVATGTVSGTNGITVTAGRSAVGGALAIDCTVASGSAAGCLASADWTTFNNKQPAGSYLTAALTGLKQTYGATQTGATQTLATSSDTNIGLTITTGSDSHTFTPTWIGTLADDRISSAATWNAKQASLGTPTAGFVAAYLNGAWTGVATTTFSGGLTYLNGNVTNTLTAGDGLTRNTDDIDLDIPVLVASGGTGVTSFTANSLLYSNSAGTALAFAATSSLNIGGNAATVTTNANLSGVVTSSGNTTSYGSQTAGVLGNAATGNTAPMATSTLYGVGAYGNVLMYNSGLKLTATSTLFTYPWTVANGGTGASTLTGVLVGNGASAFTAVGAQTCTNQFVRAMSAAYVATCATVSLTADVTGDLPFANLAQVSANSVLGNITSATSDAASIATSSLFQWTGTGQVVRGTSPTLVTPALGTPSALVGTNITGTAASLTAGLATALAANGANCSAGNYPLGVDALGAVESCTAAGSGGANSKWATTTAPDAFGIYLNSANKVGIGTSTPRWGLTASSSTAPQLTLTDASATAAPWNFRAIGNMLYISTSSPTTYATTSPAAISIDSTGKPGLSIGSTTPFATLAVNPVAGGFDNQMVVGSSSATSLRLDNSGHLFLPQLTQSGLTQTYNMCGAGTTFEAVWDTVTCLVSARKYKKDEQPISAVEALRVVMALRPLTYLKREPLNQTDAGRQPGFIADDVENVEPMLVSYDMQGEVRGFRYEQYTAYLTGAIQGQQDMIEKLTKRIEKLEQPNMCMYEY